MRTCGNCANYNHERLCHTDVCGKCFIEGANGKCGTPSKWKSKPLSNGDRIRGMSDYELAEFISGKIADQRFLCDRENGNEFSIGEQMAVRHNHFCAWIKWLKQPAKEVT